jgi:hypothetical protein
MARRSERMVISVETEPLPPCAPGSSFPARKVRNDPGASPRLAKVPLQSDHRTHEPQNIHSPFCG